MESIPLIVISAPAVKVTPVPAPILVTRLPATVKAVAEADLATDPAELLSVRLPYVLAVTV